jgi:hypothetical protein
VGEAGVKVRMANQWLDANSQSIDELRRRYGDILTPEDVDAARRDREEHRDEIDERIREESRALSG